MFKSFSAFGRLKSALTACMLAAALTLAAGSLFVSAPAQAALTISSAMRSSIELAAEQRAARADALRVEIAQTDDLIAKPDADEATKAALARKRAELQGELDDLVKQS